MKTKTKISAYILRGSATALLLSCVIVALCSAISLPEQGAKALGQYNRRDGTLNDGKFFIWSSNSIGGSGSAAREDLGGNPDRIRISTSAAFRTGTVTAIKDDFTTSIPFEGDTFTFSVDFLSGAGASGHGQALLLLVRQGNDIYGLPLGVTGVQANWATLVFNGTFNQAAFSHILGPGGPTPDFTSGLPTHFGFASQNFFSSITSYYDNFHLVSDAVSICVPPPPDMVSWWPGDGNAHDIVGSNNGTLHNGATFVPGMVDQAFSFDGINDYVQTTAIGLPFGAAARTLDFWMKPAFDAREPVIYGNFLPNDAFYIIVIGTHACIGQWGGGDACGSTNVTDGNWHQVALTYDGGSSAVLYVDGALETSANKTYATTQTGTLFIGSGGLFEFYEGLVDEIEIFNRALSQAEIQSIVNAGSAGKCKPSATPSPTPTATATMTPTATATASATATPTATASSTPRPSPTPRSRPTPAPRP